MLAKRLAAIVVGVSLAASFANAQFKAEAQLDVLYDDNIFNTSSEIADKILLGSLGLGLDVGSDRSNLQLYYTGLFSYFTTVTERTFSYHSTGIEVSLISGDRDQTLLTGGALYNLRVNREPYTYYDFGQVGLYANLRHDFSTAVRGRMGYNLRLFDFRELAEFNYLEHYAFGQLTFMFGSRTTLILEADLGSKRYSSPLVEVDSAGMGMGPGSVSVTESRIVPRVTQLMGILRIGQGLTESTGLSVTGQILHDIEKQSQYLSSDYGGISDDEVFDDHYAYEGHQLDLVMTQMLTENTTLKALAGYQHRHYAGWTVFDEAGLEVIADDRLDERMTFSVRLSHYLEALDGELYVDWIRIRSDSNDPSFDYINSMVSVGISVPLN